MVNIDMKFSTEGLKAKDVIHFLLTMDDKDYKGWWPGTHLKCVRKKHRFYKHEPFLGDIVYTKEKLGSLTVPLAGMVISVVPERQITWQALLFGMRIPGALQVSVEDAEGGVKVRHSVIIGYDGIGKVFDPIIKLFIPEALVKTIDEHARIEFSMLRDVLHAASRS